MSLLKMDKPFEAVRFMDDTDIAFTMDSRKSSGENQTLIEFNTKPIVFRASYRDISLITAIINRAADLSRPSQRVNDDSVAISSKPSTIPQEIQGSSIQGVNTGQPRTLVAQEQVRRSFSQGTCLL
jgi:vacuolar protein sorting-associated protein 13A/C